MKKFKILAEKPSDNDVLLHGAHLKIAKSLNGLIGVSEEAFCIGLEGRWGSGKSTIINLLKGKFINKKKDIFIIFDAWAHEADLLRKAFLDELISGVHDGKDKDDFRRRIRSERTVDLKPTGILVVLATLMTPLAVSFFSMLDYGNLNFSWGLGAHPIVPLWAGFLCVIPLLILASKLLMYWKGNGIKHQGFGVFGFLKGEDVSIEKISGDKTTIEFEKIYCDVINWYKNKTPGSKIIIAIDNLDRLDAAASKKIWNTLQIFIQANTRSDGKDSGAFIILSYDKDIFLRNLESLSEYNDDYFLRKNIQVRVDVPDLMVSNWMSYLDFCLEEAFAEENGQDGLEGKILIRKIYVEYSAIFRHTPTPRCIRAYVNQVCYMLFSREDDVPWEVVARYCAFLLRERREKLYAELTSSSGSEFIPKSEVFKIGLASLYFGVNDKDAGELLIAPIVESVFGYGAKDKKNIAKLKDVMNVYEKVFPAVWVSIRGKVLPTENHVHEHLVHCVDALYEMWEKDASHFARDAEHMEWCWKNSSLKWIYSDLDYSSSFEKLCEMRGYENSLILWYLNNMKSFYYESVEKENYENGAACLAQWVIFSRHLVLMNSFCNEKLGISNFFVLIISWENLRSDINIFIEIDDSVFDDFSEDRFYFMLNVLDCDGIRGIFCLFCERNGDENYLRFLCGVSKRAVISMESEKSVQAFLILIDVIIFNCYLRGNSLLSLELQEMGKSFASRYRHLFRDLKSSELRFLGAII